MTDFWLGPDLNADLVPFVEQPEQWPESREACAMLQMYSQQTGAEFENQYDVGLNYHARLVEHRFYYRINELGVPLAFETAGIKDWSPDGEQAAWSLQNTFNRVRVAGGDVAAFTLDDPLAAAQNDIHPALSMEQAVAAVCRVLEVGDANGVRGGITEAFPLCSAADIVRFFEGVQKAGRSPAHMHLDIDEQHLKQTMSEAKIQEHLRKLQFQCRAWGIPFGIILNGQRGDTPEAYKAGLMEWFTFVRRMLGGDPARYILQSWKKKNLPVNLPDSDPLAHTALLNQVVAVVHADQEGGMVGEWVDVKIATVNGETVAVNPNGTTRSLFPAYNEPVNDSYAPYHWEEKPASEGAHGGFERCAPSGTIIAWNPTGREQVIFGFLPKSPNNTGFSAMTVNPIKIETVPL